MSAMSKSGSGVPPLNQEKKQRRDASATLFSQRGGLGKAHQLFRVGVGPGIQEF
jgi:hypothetical protein